MEENTQVNEMEKSNNVTSHPSYYNLYPIETIDMMERIFGTDATRLWCIMTAFKYRMRMGYKDDINVDMQKEQWYLKKADELLTKLK